MSKDSCARCYKERKDSKMPRKLYQSLTEEEKKQSEVRSGTR